MIQINAKTLDDLEFKVVLNQAAAYCITPSGKSAIESTLPFKNRPLILKQLGLVNEFRASFDNDNRIPNHGFDCIAAAIKLLRIENNFLEIESFRKIAHVCTTTNILIAFFIKFKDYYPLLYKESLCLEVNKSIAKEIDNIIDKYGAIRNNASAELYAIRKSINAVKTKINSSFNAALHTYNTADLLDEIKETVFDNRRVLAVKAMNRRKVKGSIMGSSKTGSIVYIEPETTQQHQRELNNLCYEEGEEIKRLLISLTDFIRIHKPLLEAYQKFLIEIDVIYAKSKYAQSINGVLPILTEIKEIELNEAYHPLLLRNNKLTKTTTYPQNIKLDINSRIIVISGPNAGGKSITLKTVGLLQLLLQSGFLIPAHEKSRMCVFDRILTDIGDNQSIENQLSTYSYRLKQMNYFLKKCNENTMFLIDEFGTGSDPELGGALAETFLEVFYDRKAYGIITTHYSNLKILANEMPHMQNANMLFDAQTLKPLYKLAMGQAGSSFTFEVAEKNGIPYGIINKAKKKIERGKIRFDKTIAKLQKERSKLEKTERILKKQEISKSLAVEKLESTNKKAYDKLKSYQELFDVNQKLLRLGQKVKDLSDRYLTHKRKRELMNDLFKLVQIENAKQQKLTAKQKKILKDQHKKLSIEVAQKVSVIRKKRKIEKAKAALKPTKPKHIFSVGERVRLDDGKAVGIIDKLEKNKAIVNYGMFTTSVNIDRLELVEGK